MGHLAKKGTVDDKTLKEAMFYGAVSASFTVEEFSFDRHRAVTFEDIQKRYDEMVAFTTL